MKTLYCLVDNLLILKCHVVESRGTKVLVRVIDSDTMFNIDRHKTFVNLQSLLIYLMQQKLTIEYLINTVEHEINKEV